MSDIWVEVVKSAAMGGRKYYWDRLKDQVRWDAPPGIRVVWAMEREPSSGDVYFWNRDTLETAWELPPPGRSSGSGCGGDSGTWNGKGRSKGGRGAGSWEDAWEDDYGSWAPASGSEASQQQKRQGRPSLSGGRSRAEAPLGEPGSPADVAELAERLRAHLARLDGVRCLSDEEASKLLDEAARAPSSPEEEEGAGEGDAAKASGALLLLECDRQRPIQELFPSDFFVVEPIDSAEVSEGFLVVDIRASSSAVDDAVSRLARCWWALAQASSRFATLLFAVAPSGAAAAGGFDEEECSDLASLHQQMAFCAPAPLAFAVLRAGDDRAAERRGGGSHRRAAHAAAAAASSASPDKAAGGAKRRDEEDLVRDIVTYLEKGPREVQELASNFAQRFNVTVRSRPDSPYNKDGKNDGSFKKWLLSRGFLSGALFEYNKSMISVPADGIPTLPSPQKRSGKDISPAPASPKPSTKPAGTATNTPSTRPAHSPQPPSSSSSQRGGSAGSFRPPHGLGSPEAKRLENEVVQHLGSHGLCDMGSLRQVKDLGSRFNNLFFQRSKVNDGSWKRWLASLPGVEVVADPAKAPYHGNQPTMVRLRRAASR